MKKVGTLHEFACQPCAGVHANLLCIVPILRYVLPLGFITYYINAIVIVLGMIFITVRMVLKRLHEILVEKRPYQTLPDNEFHTWSLEAALFSLLSASGI